MIEEELPPDSQPLPSMIELYERDVHNCPQGHHLDLPIKVAYLICSQFTRFWPFLMDFIQEGNLELLRCVDVFNEKYPDGDNTCFRSYAAACIRGAIYHYFTRIPSIYIPNASRYQMRKQGRDEEIDLIEHGVSLEDLYESMIEIEAPTTMQAAFCQAKWVQVQSLLSSLSTREKEVICLHYGIDGPEHIHTDIAQRLGITPTQTRFLERKSIRRMQGMEPIETREHAIERRAQDRNERLQTLYAQYQGKITIGELTRLAHCHKEFAAQFLREQKGK